MAKGTFACAINCMDGRTQEPIAKWLKENLKVEYVDTVTEPGPDGLLANDISDLVSSIKARVLISVEKHGSDTVAVVAHHDCAGHPVPKDQHLKDLEKAVEVIRSWQLPIRILGFWVNEDWVPELLIDISEE